MASLNRIILVGRLTANPEIRTTVDGVPMARFQLSVERRRLGATLNEIDLIDIIAWRSLSEFVQTNLSKGQIALVEGRMQTRSFETSEGGRRYITEVVANNVVAIDSKKNVKAKNDIVVDSQQSKSQDEIDYFSEDLPF